MTTTQIKERIEKAQKRHDNKLNTIAKKQKWIDSGKKDAYECDWLRDDIKRLTKEVAELEVLIEKYNKQLTGEMERESMFVQIPEILHELAKELVERWTEWDINRRAFLQEEYSKLGYKGFWQKRYSMTDYNLMRMSDAAIRENNEKDADAAIKDLFLRVHEITGEITGWDCIKGNGVTLNGVVEGKAGRARVETIYAGGYNIQRLHLRTLVHSI